MNIPTVLDQIGDEPGSAKLVLQGCRGWRGQSFTTAELLDWFGIDPGMPVAVLRALLAEHNTPTPDPQRMSPPCPVCAVPNPESSPQ